MQTKEEKIEKMQIFEDVLEAYISYLPPDEVPNSKSKKKVYTRPAERGMILYLHYMIIVAKFIKPGDLLLSDGEASFNTPIIQKILVDNNIKLLLIRPSVLHQLLNPCDNDFHSIFKLSYYRRISRMSKPQVSVSEKLKIAKDCYDNISETSVARLFIKCGLIGNQDKFEVLTKLMCEGIRCLGKYNGLHKDNLISFLTWCKENELEELRSSLTPVILKLVGMSDICL